MALGGCFAALAVVIMSLGGLIPASTFVCPILSILLLTVVKKHCGTRVAWAWYGAVTVLSVLFDPDKEAAAVFAFLGCYPIVKPEIEKMLLCWLWKFLYFNSSVLIMYWMLIRLFGMDQLMTEFAEMGFWLTLITLALGNITFFMLDRLLSGNFRFWRKNG
jgi:hypothetical protein